MTTIVASVDRGSITMAGDTRMMEPATGRYYDSGLIPKVAVRNGIIFGVAGSQRFVHSVILGWEPPTDLPEDPALAMHTAIYPSLLEHVGDEDGDWGVLVGYAGHLFVADADGTVHDEDHTVAAVGSGAAYALGHLQHLSTHPPAARLSMAVCVAAEFDVYTSTNSTVAELPDAVTE